MFNKLIFRSKHLQNLRNLFKTNSCVSYEMRNYINNFANEITGWKGLVWISYNANKDEITIQKAGDILRTV